MIDQQLIAPKQKTTGRILTVGSTAFDVNELLPIDYTSEGKNVNPPLSIDIIPKKTKSIAVLMEEPDSPYGSFCHWLLWNLPPVKHIHEDEKRGITGLNDLGYHKYNGPFPVEGIHRYFFRVYALDCKLDIQSSCDRMQFDQVMRPHVIAYGLLTARVKV